MTRTFHPKMKRRLEVTAPGAAFFELDEAVDILMKATVSPSLLVSLISLSKELRRRAWDFLCHTTKWDMVWLSQFLHHLRRFNHTEYGRYLQFPELFFIYDAAKGVYFGRTALQLPYLGAGVSKATAAQVLIIAPDPQRPSLVAFGYRTFNPRLVIGFDFAAQALGLSLERRQTEQHRAEWTAKQLFLSRESSRDARK